MTTSRKLHSASSPAKTWADHPLNTLLGDPPWMFAVVNTTPDSFSDGGRYFGQAAVVDLPAVISASGAQAVDIGGESTAPGRTPVSAIDEISRIEPVVTLLSKRLFVSVDTYKSQTAAWALERGVKMINDVSALRSDKNLASVIREHGAFVVLMYSKESDEAPHATKSEREYDNVLTAIGDFLSRRLDYALAQGIPESRIVIDPGMGGFVSPNPEYSWQILAGLDELQARFPGLPIMVGTSRKGFLGGPVESRDPASSLTALTAVLHGAAAIRTHRPEMVLNFLDIWDKCSHRIS